MAVQRRVNWISQQRVDVPDVRAIESAASNDMDVLVQSYVTGAGQSFVIRGFSLSMAGAINGAASALSVVVDPGALFHVASSQSGTVFLVPPGTAAEVLNSAINPIVDGAFAPNVINYVGLEYERFIDDTTQAQVYIWDPTTNAEIPKTAPRAQILRYRFKITSNVWAANVLPLAIVQTDAGNNVIRITDSRNLLFSLGTGGASPNLFFNYFDSNPNRTPGPVSSTSDATDPFSGGDKSIDSQVNFNKAVMSRILEITGSQHWTDLGASGSLASIRSDVANTVVTGNSIIAHGVLPNTTPVLITTGNITSGSDQLSSLASTSGIAIDQVIIGAGIPTNTRVLGISGGTVTMSNNATASTTGVTVAFYVAATVTAPGQINWASNPAGTGQIYLTVVGSRLAYEISENPTGSTVTLTDDQAAYISLVRGVNVTPNLIFTNGSPIVSAVGGVSWTTNLQAGDFIKQSSDTEAGYYEIFSVDSLAQVTLTENYQGTSTGATGAKSNYAFGVYTLPGSTGTARDIVIANRYAVPVDQNTVWLFLREDDGGSFPRIYIKFSGAELTQGSSQSISGPELNNVLQYIGSPTDSAIFPEYVLKLDSGALPQISSITVPAASALSSNQYFFIYSAANSRRYYVWINKNGTGVDPMPLFNGTPIEWTVTTGQTAAQVALSLQIALNDTFFNDFTASALSAVVTVTNNSSGSCTAAANFNVGAGFSVSTSQSGVGIGNYSMNDADDLTLAIKKIDDVISSLTAGFQRAGYDEFVSIVASGATPPTSVNGPVSSLTNIELPLDSRNGNTAMFYGVDSGKLQVFLNGQKLFVNEDYSEVGSSGASSKYIEILRTLVVGDELEFTFGGGGGGGGGGTPGPAGSVGPQGPPGNDAAGGPISISTKTSNYTVLTSDCFLRADCTSAPVTFTLPSAASAVGRIFYFKKADLTANAMTVFSTDTIDDGFSISTSISTTLRETFSVISNGVTWDVF